MRKILIIEDEQMLANMYRDKLEREGLEVLTAATSEEGFQKAKAEKPDAILLDIILQNTNGLSFLWKKQDDPDIASIPVIAFSNFEDPKVKREALTLGACAYLLKTSHTPKDIVSQLKSCMLPENNPNENNPNN
ncbi:MAG: response regulator [Candidatus Wildermuthbacteria bacterium]|nr:response regulator [Candidatus Wildermuthbacteria bacterium]